MMKTFTIRLLIIILFSFIAAASQTHSLSVVNIYVPKLWLDKETPKVEISENYEIETLLESSGTGSNLIIRYRSKNDSYKIVGNYGAAYLVLPSELNVTNSDMAIQYLDSSLNTIDGYEFSLSFRNLILEILKKISPGIPGSNITVAELAEELFKFSGVGSIENIDISGTLFSSTSGYTALAQIWDPIYQYEGIGLIESDVLQLSVHLDIGKEQAKSIIDEYGVSMFLYVNPSNVTANIGLLKDKMFANTCTDIDGNVYETVQIGNQIWMAENLKVTHYRNGDPIPTGLSDNQWITTTAGAYAVYDNNESNADTYGYLYNWYAVNDERGLAPEGWHIPTVEEWTELTNYLGNDAGSQLAGRADLWNNGSLENNANFGTSGFNALPAGWRSRYGYYDDMGYNGVFWSSSGKWGRDLSYDRSKVYVLVSIKYYGKVVRLVRD